MFNTSPAAPVSKIKLPSVVSAFAFISIRLPARLKGITQETESALKVGIVRCIFFWGGMAACRCAATGRAVNANPNSNKITLY